jgi:hypothetical protein
MRFFLSKTTLMGRGHTPRRSLLWRELFTLLCVVRGLNLLVLVVLMFFIHVCDMLTVGVLFRVVFGRG